MSREKKFKIVAIGTGDMFECCVRTLLEDSANNDVAAIFTWSETSAKKMSRSTRLEPLARETNTRLIQVDSMNDTGSVEELRSLKPDLVFVDGWNEKLNPETLDVAPEKFVCIHPSLLPKYRGGATLNWALIHGHEHWGLTLFYMAEKIDQGDIIGQATFSLEARDNIKTAFDKATVAACDLLRDAILQLRAGTAPRIPQNHSDATYFKRRTPAQGEIDWKLGAKEIYNLIRALSHPYPGAFFDYEGQKIYVWQATPLDAKGADKTPGTIIEIAKESGVTVACKSGFIQLQRLQSEHSPEMWADEWCERQKIEKGSLLQADHLTTSAQT